ncbi:MAG: FkbM family methyltransferase [Rhodospirillales bacterium]
MAVEADKDKAPVMLGKHLRLRPCRHGPMLYSLNDEFIGRSYEAYGEMNENEVRLQCSLVAPGDVVLDIGANIGVNVIPLAKRVGAQGKIIAFEPQRIVHQMLCANLALNGLTNVVAHWAAVGAQAGTICVPPIDYNALGNFGGIALRDKQGEAVPIVTVDQLALDRCRLIKIDVEGMELEVLQGAGQTIDRLRPLLYFENNLEEKSPPLVANLLARGYRLYWHLLPLFNSQNFRGEPTELWPNIESVNVLGLPPGNAAKTMWFHEITSPNDWWKQLPPDQGIPPPQ